MLSQLYPDDNHKPEMALAISDGFEALCSFRYKVTRAAGAYTSYDDSKKKWISSSTVLT
jgi:mannose-6-phosphate isomerase class I